jgi:cytosine/adenosine deaminase-related metal-dependent hydrolase
MLKIFLSLIVLLLVTACGALPAVQVDAAAPTGPADTGMLLSGRVVTMNSARDVLENARVWVRAGRIEAIVRAGEPLPPGAMAARAFETGGVIYPGLIDVHNHPEYAVFPLMPLTRKYKDRYEWRYYDDDYARRISAPNIVLGRTSYYELGMEMGLWGEYMALAGGTTSLQGGGSGSPGKMMVAAGGRYFGPWAAEECLVRNIETAGVGGKPAFSYVDIGRDRSEWKKLQDDYARGKLLVHLAEGPSSRMADEFRSLKAEGLLGPDLIAIHGVGLTEAQLKEMAEAGAGLVWSPLSNFLLYGRTANVRAAKAAGVLISIAPDWAPSGSKSVLGELKVADLVNRRELGSLFSDRELVEMATRNPAQSLGWEKRLGQIAEGFLADLLVVDERNLDAYRNLVLSTEENIRLVMVRGAPLYGDKHLLAISRAGLEGSEETASFPMGRIKSIVPNCAGTKLPQVSLKEVAGKLQQGLQFNAAYTAGVMSREQISKDLALCGLPPMPEMSVEEDAKRMLACRFNLPFERTNLNPLTVQEDAEYLSRLVANPNIPAYVRSLPDYYRRQP